MKTKIIFQGSVWQCYYVEVNLKGMAQDLAEKLKFMDYFVPAYVSALTGKRVDKLLDEAKRVVGNAKRRITTGVVNDVVMNLVAMNEPPTKNGQRLKIRFATQASVCPPTFVVFTNDASLMHFSYLRYLENGVRESFDFSGTPIRIIVRDKTRNPPSAERSAASVISGHLAGRESDSRWRKFIRDFNCSDSFPQHGMFHTPF